MPYRKRNSVRDGEGKPLPHDPPRTTWTVEVAVYLLVLLTPLAIGTVHLWTVLGMLAMAATAYTSLLVRTRGREHAIKVFPLGVVLLGACVLTGLQVLPLPGWAVGVLNPGAAETFDEALAGTGLWGEGQWRALSLSPPSTAFELLKLLAYALTFLTVVNYFTDRHRARRLLKAVAWSGFLTALVGFFTKLFMAREILGFYPLPRETFFFSTFVNPNHLAGFLLMCSPVALGLSFSARGRQDRALYGFMGVIMGAAVFMSLSRGGMVAFVAGMCFLFVFSATRRARRLRRTALVQGAAAAVLIVAGYLAYDAILTELRTIGDLEAIQEETKIRSFGAIGPMIADHPVVGIGRGAHATVYPRYKTLPHRATFTHAENQTLQYLADWGPVFGGLFILGLIGCFLLGLARAWQSYALGGCLSGLFAVFLHNQVDYNLETGGVMLTFVVLFGVLAASPMAHARMPGKIETRWRLARKPAWALVIASISVASLAAPYAWRYDFYRATDELLARQGIEKPAEPCDGSELGQAACEIMDHHPADYLAPLLLGRAHLRAPDPGLTRAVHWLSVAMHLNPTDPLAHRLAGRALFLAGKKDQALGEYRLAARNDSGLQTAAITEVLRLSNDPQAAIDATPDDAGAYLETARILNTLGRKHAAARAGRLALERDSALLPALDLLSTLALEGGRLAEATDLARQAIEVDAQHDRAWVMRGKVLLARNEVDQAEEVWREGWAQVPDSTLLAYRLVELYISQKRYKDAETIAARMQTFVSSDDRSQARLLLLLGRIKEARQMFFDARQLYRQAIELQPGNLPYLYRLGRMEEKVGAWDEAERIYARLEMSHFRTREMKERIDLVRKARQIEKDRAMWNRHVEP